MSIDGWYYLHTNGSLIHKRELYGTAAVDIRESDFARGMWPVDPADRESAWRIVVEGLAAGADPARITELAALWQCSDEDADIYAERVGCFIDRDGDMWCAKPKRFVNLQETVAGFGPTKREAMSDLCKSLGYRPSKTWGSSFADLLFKCNGEIQAS